MILVSFFSGDNVLTGGIKYAIFSNIKETKIERPPPPLFLSGTLGILFPC